MQARLSRIAAINFLYEAAGAGGLQVRAQLCGLIRRSERAYHGAVIDPFGAKIGATNDRRTTAEQIGIFSLQVTERGLRLLFATLRRDLNRIAAACCCRRRCRCC